MRKLRVGIVDDEPSARKALNALFQRIDICEVVGEAENGKQALKMVEMVHPEVILIDIIMPDMTGIELLKCLKSQYSDIQAIILTMYRDFNYAIEAIRNGALDYLIKDTYDCTQLFRVLEHAMTIRNEQEGRKKQNFETELNIAIAKKIWIGRSGRLIQIFESSIEMSLYEQLCSIKSLNIQGKIYPVKQNIWYWETRKSDEEIRKNVKKFHQIQNYQIVFSKHIESIMEENLSNMLYTMEEKFYLPENIVVSGIIYDRNASYLFRESIIRAFNHFMMGKLETFWNELSEKCKRQRIHPESIRNTLVSCLEEWQGNEEARRVHEAETLKKVQLIVRGFSLKIQLDSDKGERMEIQYLKQYILDNLSGDLSLKMLADEMHYNPSYISTIFKKRTGEGIKRYIVATRMQRASAMLRESNMKVYEIAEACGFMNVRYFSDAFMKAYGMTPIEYREKIPHA